MAFNLSHAGRGEVIPATKDVNLRIKADVVGVRTEDFYNDKVDYAHLYSGIVERHLSACELDEFYQEGKLKLSGCQPLPNQFFLLKCHENQSQSALARYSHGMLLPLCHADSVSWGIKALNKEQKFALELLRDDQIRVVTLVGRAGTGKTLLALAVGLEKVLEENAYSRLLVTWPVIPMGEDLGYLPGTKEEKLRPWMQLIFDNLEFLMRNCPEPDGVLDDLVRKGDNGTGSAHLHSGTQHSETAHTL